jgi:hypothetical protein
MSEMASEVRQGFDNLADAVRTLAGCIAAVAAGAHTDTKGDQRDMAAVFFLDAQDRFSDILRKMDPKLQAEFENYITALCRGKR